MSDVTTNLLETQPTPKVSAQTLRLLMDTPVALLSCLQTIRCLGYLYSHTWLLGGHQALSCCRVTQLSFTSCTRVPGSLRAAKYLVP